MGLHISVPFGNSRKIYQGDLVLVEEPNGWLKFVVVLHQGCQTVEGYLAPMDKTTAGNFVHGDRSRAKGSPDSTTAGKLNAAMSAGLHPAPPLRAGEDEREGDDAAFAGADDPVGEWPAR